MFAGTPDQLLRIDLKQNFTDTTTVLTKFITNNKTLTKMPFILEWQWFQR